MRFRFTTITDSLIPETLKTESKSLWLSRVVVSMSLALGAIAVLGTTVRLLVTGQFGIPGIILLTTGVLVFGIVYDFRKRGNIRLSSIFLITLCWMVMGIFPFLEGGIKAPGLMLMLGMPLLAAVFTSLRYGIILSILSAAVHVVLFVCDKHGIQFGVLSTEEAEIGRLVLTIFTLGFLMVVCWLFFNSRRIDEHKQQELINYLEKANAELREHSYAFSHDMKTPLRGIYSLTQFMEDELEGADETVLAQFGLIRSRVDRMQRYLDAMIAYTSIGMKEAELKKVNTKQLVSELAASDFKDSVQFTIDDTLPSITADETQLNTVFTKLFENAVTHSRASEPKIKVSHSDDGFFYQFSISDNGVGIKEKYFDKIFKLFATLGHKDEIENSGIGLTIVKKIIELNGGRIRVFSEEGNGTTISFTWPKHVEPYRVL